MARSPSGKMYIGKTIGDPEKRKYLHFNGFGSSLLYHTVKVYGKAKTRQCVDHLDFQRID